MPGDCGGQPATEPHNQQHTGSREHRSEEEPITHCLLRDIPFSHHDQNLPGGPDPPGQETRCVAGVDVPRPQAMAPDELERLRQASVRIMQAFEAAYEASSSTGCILENAPDGRGIRLPT